MTVTVINKKLNCTYVILFIIYCTIHLQQMCDILTDDSKKNQQGCILLLQPKICSDQKLNIFSIAKTKQSTINVDFEEKHKKIAIFDTINVDKVYSKLYDEFCKVSIQRKDIGSKYFEANIDILLKLFNKIMISQYENENKNNNNMTLFILKK